jgi:RND family efflux transporter MFP subunit
LLTRPDESPDLDETVPLRVVVARVEAHDLVPYESVSGRLEPKRRASLHFEVSGQIRSRAVEPGQVVAADSLLLSLAEGDFRDALASAEARLQLEGSHIERDRELLKLAQRNRALQQDEVTRLETLNKDSLISRSLLDAARIKLVQLDSEVAQLRNNVATAEARLGLLEAERNQAARNLQRTRLLAPFPGYVNAVHVQVGDYVTPSQAALEIIDTTQLDLYVEVRGELARALSQGQQVAVTADDHRLQGTVVALQVDPDPETFTHALRIRLPGNAVRSGMVARARLPLRPLRGVTAVPVTALLQDEGRAYVFRVADDRLARIEVVPGRRVGDLQVVNSTLQAGDRVVVRDVAALSDGQQVRLQIAE